MFCFIICFPFLFPPSLAPVVPDGQGGFVPFTNSRVMADGSLRPYDPYLDGIMLPDGRIIMPESMQGPALSTPKHDDHPRHATKPAHETAQPCYDGNGKPVIPVPDGCVTEDAPMLPQPQRYSSPDHDREL
jgi:hypothetical protein